MTNKEYEEIAQRVSDGKNAIEKVGGFMKAPRKWVKLYNYLAYMMLEYELENDLLPL
jgi:hypothetical protein